MKILKLVCLILVSIFFSNTLMSSNAILYNQLLDSLKNIILHRHEIDKLKEQKINQYKLQLQKGNNNKLYNYQLLKNIYEEYKAYQYDSAFIYCQKLIQLAHELKTPAYINEAKLNYSFILLSAGLFKETFDSLKTINIYYFSDSLKVRFYYIKARTYFDNADYINDNYYFNYYNLLGKKYLDTAIILCDTNSYDFFSLSGLKYIRNGEIFKAKQIYEKIMKISPIDMHQYAIESSSLSYIYYLAGDILLSNIMLIRAAIADIRSSTKETTALRNLANRLMQQDKIDLAFSFIKVALEDATFYNARHRKVQVTDVLPNIEERQLAIVDNQRKIFIVYSIVITIMTVIIVLFLIIILKQLKKLKKTKIFLTKMNYNLTEFNKKLIEANTIKETYITQFFNSLSSYIERLEKLKTSINRKILTHQFDDIKELLQDINIKTERESFYAMFDQIFLSIFPSFIQLFNNHITDDQLKISSSNDSLPPELRIYALIRLGITDNEKIARFLDYSLNTIYTYKARIRGKLNIPIEEFESKLMQIPTI